MDKQGLIQFICEMFNIKECPKMILQQIHKNITERRYTYLEIARALSYYVDVKGQPLEIKYGIGIVPFVMDDARKHFAELERQRQEQIKAAQEAHNGEKQVITVKVKPKKSIKKPKIDITSL